MEVKAPAKLNLTLEVLGKRDDGYHEIRTVFQAVDLFDTIRFTLSQALEFHCSDPCLSGKDNLVWRAAAALSRATGKLTPASIHLEKEIPHSMGLGGGSSDAAATLEALNNMLDLGCRAEQLQEIAASIGSDVPFFLVGGAALGKGRGDELASVPDAPESSYVILCPDLPQEAGPKTGRLYSFLTPENYSDGSYTERMVESLSLCQPIQPALFNVFDQVADRAFPGLQDIRADFSRTAGTQVHLSGSGPALFCAVEDTSHGERTLKSLQSAGHRSYLVTALASREHSWTALESNS